MAQHLPQQILDGINRSLKSSGSGFTACFGHWDTTEVIIGRWSEDLSGSITVKLANDPGQGGRETWYIALFPNTSPKEVSTLFEIETPVIVVKEVHWAKMLTTVSQLSAGLVECSS